MASPELHPFAQEVPPPAPITMTLAEFLASDLEGYEYVKGELIPMPPTSLEHGDIGANMFWHLLSHIRENQLGRVYTSDTGFQVGERVLMPDVAFVSTARLPENRKKASPVPPDLAIEVVSPTDTQSGVSEKVQAYLDAGTSMVWVLDPVLKTVTVYRPNDDYKLLTRRDILTGEDVVEGFSCEVAKFFE